jgi:hypothetical protein
LAQCTRILFEITYRTVSDIKNSSIKKRNRKIKFIAIYTVNPEPFDSQICGFKSNQTKKTSDSENVAAMNWKLISG